MAIARRPTRVRLTEQGRRKAREALRRFRAGESVESIAADLTDGRQNALQFLLALAQEVGALDD